MTARKCQYTGCPHVALLGSPEAADAIDARNCAVCDHGECNALSGITTQYRGPVPALFEPAPADDGPDAPAPPPGDPRFDVADVPDAWLPCEAGYVPELPEGIPLQELIDDARGMLARAYGPELVAHVGTEDGRTYQCVARDVGTRRTRTDLPTGVGLSDCAAVWALITALQEVDAWAADRAVADQAHHVTRGPSLADAYPPITVSMEEARALAAADDEACDERRAEVA